MLQLYGCTLASNNSGLITRIKDSGMVLYPAPSLSLAPDWDIISEIELACKQLQIQHPSTIQHVKGHQDREKKYHEMDLISQLNVNSDSAAGRFQEIFSAIRPIVHRMPNNSAQLHLPRGTFNSKYKQQIRYADSAPALLDHMRNKYDWTVETTDKIDWTAHGQAIHRSFDQKTHNTKFVHDILPTNHRVHRYDKTRSTKCLSRESPDEDRDHIL
jgi:hypothetical protein